MFIAFKSW